jgi:hypothetical protein
MVIIIVAALLSIILIGWLGWFGRRYLERRRAKRMSDNAYNTALTLWNFARVIKDQLDEVGRGKAEVIDFTKISVPAGTGYNVCLELAGYGFRLHAVPERYARTGRVSLYVDDALTVRAWDRGGENATAQDPEYTGEDPKVDPAAGSQADPLGAEDQIHQGNKTTSGNPASERIIVKGDRIPSARAKARPVRPDAVNPGALDTAAINPDSRKGDSVKPDSISSDSVGGYSAKRSPSEPVPVKRDPVKRDAISGDRINSNRRDRIT